MTDALGTPAFELVLEILVASALFWAAARAAIRVARITDPVWRVRFYLLPIVAPLLVVPLIHLVVRPLLRLPVPPLEIVLDHALGFSPWFTIFALGVAGLVVVWGLIQSLPPLAALAFLKMGQQRGNRRSLERRRCERFLAIVAWKLAVPHPNLILTSGSVCSTLSTGPFGTYVLVPNDLCSALDDEELEALLAHELGHIKRKDVLLAPLVGVCRRLLAFSPFSQNAYRSFAQAREEAVDDLAIRVTGQPLALASCLLKAWRLGQRSGGQHLPLAGLLSSTAIGLRIKRVLDNPGGTETAPPRWARWAYVGSVTFVIASLLFGV